MRLWGRSEPSPGISRRTSPRARALPPAWPSCIAGEQSALDVKNQIAFQNQADLFSIVRESTFSRDLVFVFFLTAHPPRGPPPPDSAALHHRLGCTSDVSQLPDIFLTAVGAASICLHHLLAGSAPGPCGRCCASPCLPAVCYTLHVLLVSAGAKARLQSSSRDELRDCHFLNKSVLDMPLGSGSLLLQCSAAMLGQGCLRAELSWVTAGTAPSTVAGALCGAAGATGSPREGVSLPGRACTRSPLLPTSIPKASFCFALTPWPCWVKDGRGDGATHGQPHAGSLGAGGQA